MQCGCMSSKKPSTAAAAAAAPAARWFKLLPRKEEEPVEKAIRRGGKGFSAAVVIKPSYPSPLIKSQR